MEFTDFEALKLKKGDMLLMIRKNSDNKHVGFFRGIDDPGFSKNKVKVLYSAWLERLDFNYMNLDDLLSIQKLGPIK